MQVRLQENRESPCHRQHGPEPRVARSDRPRGSDGPSPSAQICGSRIDESLARANRQPPRCLRAGVRREWSGRVRRSGVGRTTPGKILQGWPTPDLASTSHHPRPRRLPESPGRGHARQRPQHPSRRVRTSTVQTRPLHSSGRTLSSTFARHSPRATPSHPGRCTVAARARAFVGPRSPAPALDYRLANVSQALGRPLWNPVLVQY
jgi:hypothetical protein